MGFHGQTSLITFTVALRCLADFPEKEKSPLDVGPKQGAGLRIAGDNWAMAWVYGNGLFRPLTWCWAVACRETE